MTRLALCVLASLAVGGCAAVYSDIRKVDDNTYILTRTKRGFFAEKGTVFSCTPIGQSPDLKCVEIDSP
jgi:hypothetical protein